MTDQKIFGAAGNYQVSGAPITPTLAVVCTPGDSGIPFEGDTYACAHISSVSFFS